MEILDNCFDLLSNIRIEISPTTSRIFSGYDKDLPHILGFSISYPMALTPFLPLILLWLELNKQLCCRDGDWAPPPPQLLHVTVALKPQDHLVGTSWPFPACLKAEEMRYAEVWTLFICMGRALGDRDTTHDQGAGLRKEKKTPKSPLPRYFQINIKQGTWLNLQRLPDIHSQD